MNHVVWGATFLGNQEGFLVRTGQPENAGQLTNTVDCFNPLEGPPLEVSGRSAIRSKRATVRDSILVLKD